MSKMKLRSVNCSMGEVFSGTEKVLSASVGKFNREVKGNHMQGFLDCEKSCLNALQA